MMDEFCKKLKAAIHNTNKAIEELPVMLDEGATMPTRAHDMDGGLDLYNRNENVVIPGATWDEVSGCTGDCDKCLKHDGYFDDDGCFVVTTCDEYEKHCGFAIIDTGVHVQIPKGYCGLMVSKSGLNVNSNLTSTGLIDAGYTGSIRVNLYNHGKKARVITPHQKISQLVILPCLLCKPVLVDKFEETERGDGGFGSTGEY